MDDLRFVFPWLADSLTVDGSVTVSDVGLFDIQLPHDCFIVIQDLRKTALH